MKKNLFLSLVASLFLSTSVVAFADPSAVTTPSTTPVASGVPSAVADSSASAAAVADSSSTSAATSPAQAVATPVTTQSGSSATESKPRMVSATHNARHYKSKEHREHLKSAGTIEHASTNHAHSLVAMPVADSSTASSPTPSSSSTMSSSTRKAKVDSSASSVASMNEQSKAKPSMMSSTKKYPVVMSMNNMTIVPYVGADYDFVYGLKGDIKDTFTLKIPKIYNALDIHGGVTVDNMWGVELGYRYSMGSSATSTVSSTVDQKNTISFQGPTLDALGYYPFAPQMKAVGLLGVGYSQFKLKTEQTGLAEDSQTKWVMGFRVGAGVQYDISDNLNARAIVLYDSSTFKPKDATEDAFKSSVGLRLGINYLF